MILKPKSCSFPLQRYGCCKNHFCIHVNGDVNFDKLVHENMFYSVITGFPKSGHICVAIKTARDYYSIVVGTAATRVVRVFHICTPVMITECLCYTLYLAAALVTVGDCSGGVSDCGIRFEDNGACACSSNDTARPVTCYSYPSKSIKIQQCYCMFYDSAFNVSIVGHCFYSCFAFSGTV